MKVTDGRVRVAASDVANFLACRRLTQLDLLRARGELRPPHPRDLGFEDLVRRGEEHERAVLERFRTDGHDVADVSGAQDVRGGTGATADAIRGGAGVVYQGTLAGKGDGVALFGRPDFLVRADLLPAPDGELAARLDPLRGRRRQAGAVREGPRRAADRVLLAICSPTCRGSRRGGCTSRSATGSSLRSRWTTSPPTSGRRGGCWRPPSAGIRRPRSTRSRWSTAPSAGGAIMCRERRRVDDDLSLVAGITTGQRRALKGAGISTRRGFAGLDDLPRLDRVSPDVLERARQQARLQVASEDDGVVRYELLDPERDASGALIPNRGLLALPEPADRGPVLRHRGRPLLLRGRPGVRAAVPVRRRRHGRRRRGGTPPVHADLGVRPAGREARVRGADGLHHRAARAPSRPARLPLQPLRADVARPSHRAARDPRGGRAAV